MGARSIFSRGLCAAVLLAGGETPAAAATEPIRPPPVTAAPSGWDKAAAARYLDDRMDLWFAKAKRLRTGAGSASCVSCHMTVPYALARPALRQAAGERQPTAQETRLLEETRLRADTYGRHELLYQAKESQSRGTEVVLNLLILAGEDARQRRQMPSAPTRVALDELWKEQRPDGAWNWLDFGQEPYESAESVYYGAALAALAVGTVPGYAEGAGETGSSPTARLRAYLSLKYSEQNLYHKVWLLLASARMNGLLSRGQKEALAAELARRRNPDGGWSQQALGPWTWSGTNAPFAPPGQPEAARLSKSDGYATGLVAYALRQGGWAAADPALNPALAWLRANQQECRIDQMSWKCWRADSLNHDREHGGPHGEPWRRMFMSDAATAFAALALLASE